MAGNKYAIVFPDPVLAMEIKSFLCERIGQLFAWISVGDMNPLFSKFYYIKSGKP